MSAEATAVPAPHIETLAIAAAGVTVVLWASAFVGIRAAGEDFSPGGLALGRLTVAAVGSTPAPRRCSSTSARS